MLLKYKLSGKGYIGAIVLGIIDIQEKILNILINNKDTIDDVLAKLSIDHFDPKYKAVFAGVINANINGVGLTVDSFELFIEKKVQDGDYAKWIGTSEKVSRHMAVNAQKNIFFQITKLTQSSKEDLSALVDKLRDDRISKQTTSAIEKYSTDIKNGNHSKAARSLIESIDGLLSENSSNKINFVPLEDCGKEFIEDLLYRRVNPEVRLFTGIHEIDESMTVGLRPGTLTLFAADVGGFKTSMMVNIAVNIFKQTKQEVMFIPLEMPRAMITRKIIAREANVSLAKIEKAELLDDKEIERLKSESQKWEKMGNKFVILDPEERTTVSTIRKAIEKRLSYFRPRVVFVDYISILSPESSYAKLNPHEWYGQMCKDLRVMGKKHGFAVVSAVQLGRDAIKRLRTQKEGQQSVGSEDLRGSHDFSADADNIYAQVPHPTQPTEKLQIFCVKARYGSKTFGKSNVALLDINADMGKITSSKDAKWTDGHSDIDAELEKLSSITPPVSDDDLDLTINEPLKTSPISGSNIDDCFNSINESTNKKKKKDNDFKDDFDL